jgi:hypothetical protein
MQTHFISLASFERDVPMLEHVNSANVATGMAVLNAVPGVCAAEPGFATQASVAARSLIGFGH